MKTSVIKTVCIVLLVLAVGSWANAFQTLHESDVIGLVSDLSVRAVTGPGFFGPRVAVIDGTGQIEGAVGTLTNCMHVDGTAAVCGPVFADGQTPSGTLNGANVTFTLASAPNPAVSLQLFRNGILQYATSDYTLSGATIQFLAGSVPQVGDTLVASYRH
jgi:hypothetical protein